ncbi:hypothetical protein [Lacinutrix sp. 5H-3-7-4]|uniref:hypothetical protein n=1 Tax=Lacinutrix sp. (strain 5H-3-7-4) TaxID=983544 RepID=UPI00020A3DF9|nr:hypothetical protein [Lacinutrix sp. 5H-3-7-4]AEH01496.1 hypothetical protein Lacal_1648 [Lacinutrix sp. 5H-3-7-4]
MKKVITLCLFAFTMLIGTQTAFAQNNVKVDQKATTKAKELRSQLKFDDSTMEKVYLAYQQYENKMLSINENLSKNTAQYKNATLETSKTLQQNIKSALGEDRFQRYLIITEQLEIDKEETQLQSKSASQVKQQR